MYRFDMFKPYSHGFAVFIRRDPTYLDFEKNDTTVRRVSIEQKLGLQNGSPKSMKICLGKTPFRPLRFIANVDP